jgi:hypothetical protein
MERIIVRNKTSKKSKISSQLMKYTVDTPYDTKLDFFKDNDFIEIFQNIFDENLDADILENTTLYSEYIKCKDSKESNESFMYMYKIDDEFCLSISENIYLHHIVQGVSINEDVLVPWYYTDSKIYFGDSWWEEDDSIISDFQKMPILEFVKKFKMY